ncbi:transient receptor potential channel pyrexia-like isoform X1 [Penaeus japonicus]|uniref:transient receptor potential channel pyrexia-like isoform X1 n=1 Tax=Penaeus japonicus TaxID=27405 RepID=UPI001C71270F|nr:transient receptor potential channel pyrexia-like isoform X1 [Penaeus japonicus]XP_042887542.1 transient receptor potential channel pyrexia-like isoform X1 [Penaeus japonicus]XP_042887543.1 transient receptor potential channel pyrexia-like isoform X1 [Penaeus japonicus]
MAGFRMLLRSSSVEDAGQDTPILRGPQPDSRFVALLEALKKRDLANVKTLLGRGLSPNHREPARGNRTPLIYAVKHDFTEAVLELVAAGANVNLADAAGITPLHMAAGGGHLSTLRILLSRGAPPDPIDNHARTPLHYAARAANPGPGGSNFVSVVEMLLSAGALHGRRDADGRLALHNAATAGSSKLIKILVRGRGSSTINFKDKEGRTPLHCAVLGARSLDAVTSLLDFGASINSQDRHGDTALHMTAGRPYNHVDDEFDGMCLEQLLSHGASVAAKNNEGLNALSLALRRTMWWGRPTARDYVLHAVQQLVAKGACIQDGFAMWRMVESFPSLVPIGLNRSFRANTSARDSPLLQLDLDFGPLTVDSQQLCEIQRQRPLNPQAELPLPPPLLRDSEVSMLHYIMWAGRKNLLKHPLCHAFLHLKWFKVRKYFLANVFFYFFFVLSLTAFLLSSHNCSNDSETSGNVTSLSDSEFNNSSDSGNNYSFSLNYLKKEGPLRCGWSGEHLVGLTWWCLVIFSALLDLREIVQIFQNPFIYIRNLGNVIDATLVVCVPQILVSSLNNEDCCLAEWQQSVGAISIILAWVRLMLFTGQFPSCGVYIVMFSTVAKNVLRFLLMYVPVLVAFALGFHVLLRSNTTFQNLGTSLVTALVMMTGELDYESTFLDPSPPLPSESQVLSICILVVFIVLVFIILSNLLVGLAVSDMYAIKQRSEVLRLTRHVELMVQVENLFRNSLIPRRLQKCLLNSISLTSGNPSDVIVSVYPNRTHGFADTIFLLLVRIVRSRKLLTKIFEIFVSGFIAPEHVPSLPSQLMGEAVNMALREHELDKREERLHLRALQVGQNKQPGSAQQSNTQVPVTLRSSIIRPSCVERASWRWTLASDTDVEEDVDLFHPPLQQQSSTWSTWHPASSGTQRNVLPDSHARFEELRKLVLNLQATVETLSTTVQQNQSTYRTAATVLGAHSLNDVTV